MKPEVNVGQAPGPDVLDFRACKRTFQRIFPPTHPVRIAIQGEPDFVPRVEGLAKLETYARVLFAMEP